MQSPRNRWLILAAVMLAFIPIVVDMTILHIAVPSLTLALGATGTEILWIIDIYPLIMAGLLVPMGTLADRVGHRRMMLIGLSIFTVASISAAFSPTAMALIASRVLLAFGASMVMPSILAIIRQTFEDSSERAIALGLWGTVGSAGAAIGPLAGGALLEHFWWGSVFLVNVPIMLLVLPTAFLLLPRNAGTAKGEWRFGQALVLIAGLIATVYAIKAGFKADASLLKTGAILVAGLGLLAWFGRQQLTAANPMLDLSLFAKPAISVGLAMALVVSGALAGVELTIAQELQYVAGKSPLEAGLFLMPLIIASAIAGPVAGKLAGSVGLRPVATTALALAAVALAGVGYADLAHGGIEVTLFMVLLGFALGVGMTTSSIAIMSSASAEKAGAAGSLESTGYELGAGLGITFFGVLLATSYQSSIALPAGAPASAASSIGEAMVAAQAAGGATGDAIAAAAQAAFAGAHGVVLLAAAGLLALLALAVAVALRHYREVGAAAAHP
ncbi:MFS transporter [Devosia lacusdianchii]|uniref:MFS transporter n=1 Tax=Devosia lacusdianchii TaxID=2917991 RepID=UPI001F06AC8A|nr:MFS transporter [Devosia sp. JXJ CY 41]